MTIKARLLKDDLKNPSGIILELDLVGKDQLLNLLNRALNCYPEAPADWKELADYLQHGKILQPYRNQDPRVFYNLIPPTKPIT